MSRVIPVTIAVAAVLAAPAASAQVTSNQDTARSPWPTANRPTSFVTNTDTAFIRQALRGNYTELALGRLAESRAENSDVKDFAERMVSEHGDMNKEWAELADDNDMNSGVSSRGAIDLGDAGEQAVDRLEDLEGAAFDQAYMNEMIRHHEQSLADFTQMGYSARSAEIRQLANNGLSPIRTHLALARQVGSRVGVSTTAGSAGGVIVPKPVPTTDTGRRTTAGRTTTSPTTTTPTTTGRTTTAAADNDRDDENATKPPLPPADRAFVRDVVSDHRMHIRLAKRAQREAKRDETRDLAERIERDFDKWEDRWLSLADRRDLEVPSRLERADRQKIERLDGVSERGFDRTYVTMLSNHLETVLQHLRKQRNDAQSPVVRRMADSEIPQVREHLEQARKLREEAEKRAEKSDRD